MLPQISVIMPVLNPDPKYFPAAIESVLAQTMPDWELIIVEDPSSRRGADFLARYPDPRIHHFTNTSRTSLVAQLNRAVDMSSAKYLARLDADDLAEPHRFAEQMRVMEAQPDLGVLGCQMTVIGPEDEVLGVRNYPVGHTEICKAMRRYSPLPHPGVFLRRAILLEAGGYRYDQIQGAEDYELWWRLLKLGVKFSNHPGRLLRYRIQPDQTKSKRLREQLLATIHVKKQNWDESFGFFDLVRLSTEKCLLRLPPALVMRLFVAITYRRNGKSS